MRDGRTRKLRQPAKNGGMREFLQSFQAKVVVVSGRSAGEEFVLDRERLTLGRGPGVDVAFDDPAMSRQHASIEYSGEEEFRIRDLGSTNGLRVNGKPVDAGDLKHGDVVEIGALGLQLVIEEREQTPEVYELSSEL